MKRLIIYTIICLFAVQVSAQIIDVELCPKQVTGKVNDKLYGLLLEHIYHSVSNGIWGETVWNRSFEELYAHGNWSVNSENKIRVNALSTDTARFYVGKGRDFEMSMEFRRTSGEGTVLVGVREQAREDMLINRINLQLGTDHNTKHKLFLSTGWRWFSPRNNMRIVDEKKGVLELGKWQRLVVRCDKNHLKAYLNSNLLFDYNLDNDPLDGNLMIGAEHCAAEFRNLKVASVNNAAVTLSINPIRHWNMVGQGLIENVSRGVLNHANAVHLVSTHKWIGIEQGRNFRIRKNDLLKGTVFLRGNVKCVLVQLLDSNNVLAQKTLTGLSADWKEFQVELPSNSDCNNATLRFSTNEKGDVFVDQVSLMHQSSIDNYGCRPDLVDAVKGLNPTLIRWPGGSFVQLYDFEKGIGPQTKREGIWMWDDFDPLSFGTDEFLAFCNRIGAQADIVVPIGYHNYKGYAPDAYGKNDWLEKALNWLEYCNGSATSKYGAMRAANGNIEPYNVKYWEIDNEVWKMDPKLYAQLVRIFSIAMKKKDPSIKIIGCGSGRLGKEGVGLDSIMINTVSEYIDYISPHHYMELDKFGKDGVTEYGNYLRKLDNWIAKSKNPDMKIYLSEWNLDKVDMRTGLFAGGFLNELEKSPRVEMASIALVLRHVSAGGWNNALINFDQNDYFVAPNYLVMKLWRDHYLPNRIEVKSESDQINLVATKSDDNKTICVKLVNSTENEQKLDIKTGEGCLVETATFSYVTASSLSASNSMKYPNAIEIKNQVAEIKNGVVRVVLPKYSAGVLELQNVDLKN